MNVSYSSLTNDTSRTAFAFFNTVVPTCGSFFIEILRAFRFKMIETNYWVRFVRKRGAFGYSVINRFFEFYVSYLRPSIKPAKGPYHIRQIILRTRRVPSISLSIINSKLKQVFEWLSCASKLAEQMAKHYSVTTRGTWYSSSFNEIRTTNYIILLHFSNFKPHSPNSFNCGKQIF